MQIYKTIIVQIQAQLPTKRLLVAKLKMQQSSCSDEDEIIQDSSLIRQDIAFMLSSDQPETQLGQRRYNDQNIKQQHYQQQPPLQQRLLIPEATEQNGVRSKQQRTTKVKKKKRSQKQQQQQQNQQAPQQQFQSNVEYDLQIQNQQKTSSQSQQQQLLRQLQQQQQIDHVRQQARIQNKNIQGRLLQTQSSKNNLRQPMRQSQHHQQLLYDDYGEESISDDNNDEDNLPISSLKMMEQQQRRHYQMEKKQDVVQQPPMYYERQYASYRTGGAQDRTSSSENESLIRDQMRRKHNQMISKTSLKQKQKVDLLSQRHVQQPPMQGDRQKQYQQQQSNFADFQEQFYPQQPPQSQRSRRWRRFSNFDPQRQQNEQKKKTTKYATPRTLTQTTQQLFEPQFVHQKGMLAQRRPEVQWHFKTTQEGFIYFYIPGTNTFQWSFPVVFDPISGRKKTLFAETWIKKYDKAGKKFYRDQDSGRTQEAKPSAETYLIQAAMTGNICFFNLYLKGRGNLGITDKRGRTALHHSVANGHRDLCLMLCEFGSFENLLERADHSGNTPLLIAIKYNQEEILKVLIQFNSNVFHRNVKGDTCLHVAALHGSHEVLPVLASFITEELFEVRNSQHMTAFDVSTSLQNFDFA